MSECGVAWRTGTENFRESTHRSCATAFQSFPSRSRLGWRSHCNITSSETWNCRFLLWPSPSPPGMQEPGLPCWPFYCPRPASTTSLRSRFTPSTFPLEIYLTFSFSSHGRQLSPRSALFDAESRTAFVKPATTFMSRWNSAGTARTKFANSIRNSAKRMGNLIDDLLAFSRIGRAETKKSEVDLEQLVEEVVAEIGQDTKSRDIAWKIGALPVCYGGRCLLRLVVVNLVSNAVKFTRMRSPAEIEIGCVNRNKKEVEVFVRDNGALFDMQYVNKLFGVFQRLHLPEQFEGTGIGLATVQRIIRRHGGHVRGEGAVDQGATFYFSLPKTQNAAERTANDHDSTRTHFDRRGRPERRGADP